MLHIWVGRAGSGKSGGCWRPWKKNRRLRRQVLLVPEHISHEAEVDLCRARGAHGVPGRGGAELPQPCIPVLAETGGLAEFTLDNGGKLLTMRRVLQELAPELRVFGRPSQRARSAAADGPDGGVLRLRDRPPGPVPAGGGPGRGHGRQPGHRPDIRRL